MIRPFRAGSALTMLPWAPPLVGFACVAGYFLFAHVIDDFDLPAEANAWIHTHLPWLWPLGARGFAWESSWLGPNPRFFDVIFERSHDIGTAYLAMRMFHYFSELKRGTIPAERRTLLNFLAYVCYAPTLIQGPIERYKEFNDEIDTCAERRTWRGGLYGVGRMLMAVAKWISITAVLLPWIYRVKVVAPEMVAEPSKVESYWRLFFAIHVSVFGLYLLFSGYCDMAIGMSRLLGYRVAENFHHFWMARNLTDMWRRWHITLSFILRDYIFFPLTKRRWNSLITLGITFGVCGVWHSLSLNYLLWGITMGLMVAVNQRWTRWMRTLDRHPQRPFSAIRRAWMKLQPLPAFCAWLLTINAFMMTGWVCFFGLAGFRVVGEILWRPITWLLPATGG